MGLSDLRRAFDAGTLSKPDYIAAMHKLHQGLFEYAEYLRQTDVGEIRITDGQVVVTTRDPPVALVCDFQDQRATPIETLNFGRYEAEEFHALANLIRDGDTIFDIGANIGYYSIALAKRFPASKVYSFEPIPATFRQLERNIKLNGASNVRAFNYGLSNEDATKSFFFYPEGTGNASAANLSGRETVTAVPVRVRRLDDVVSELGVRVDAIKCDVEGAELFVFQGGTQTLRDSRPVILTEMLRKWAAAFDYHPNDIIDLLAGVGYRCFRTSGPGGRLEPFGRMDDDTKETNFIFLEANRAAGARPQTPNPPPQGR